MNRIEAKCSSRFRLVSAIMLTLILFVTGCAGSGKPAYTVEHYLLSYPAPSANAQAPLAASVKFNRFSIAAAYNSTGMVFRNDAYSIDSFNYSRWAVNPADMIADRLLADLRAGGRFSSVLSRHDAEEGRFILSGGVEEFYLRADKDRKSAVVHLVIALSDAREKNTEKKLLFQKKYERVEILQEASPRGYAQAASTAMQALSGKIAADIYAAIKTASP